MPGRLFRRSGIAVVGVSINLGWRPDYIYQVGVGGRYEEIDVFVEEWPDVKILGVEPHPKTYRDIEKKYPGILNNVAFGSSGGEGVLHSKRRHRDGSTLKSVMAKEDEHIVSFPVRVAKMDDFWPMPPPGKKSLLWLDCEGSELEVLRGGREFVKGIDVVNIEMTSNCPEDWPTTVEIDDWMISNGFFAQWSHTKRPHQGQHDVAYVRPCLFDPRYCCFPSEIRRFQRCR